MKKIFLLLSICIGMTAAAQQKITPGQLAGTWDVFSMDIPGEMYFNMLTDSIAVKTEEGDDSTLISFKNNMIKESLKQQLAKMKFLVSADGIMYEGVEKDPSKEMGVYNAEKSVLVLKEKDSPETKDIKLLLNGDVLSMITEDKGVTVTILCKRAN